MANVTCTCIECGKEFSCRKKCRNRSEAERYEAWASEHRRQCPDCYRAEQQRRAEAQIAEQLAEWGMELPIIQGVSDKQIAYATNIRRDYMAANLTTAVKSWAAAAIETRDHRAEVEARCAQIGLTVDEAWEDALKNLSLREANIAMTSTSARQIIDALQHYAR